MSGEFDVLTAAGAGMAAERAALEVAARNVAASQADSDGRGFERLVPQFSLATAQPEPDADVPDFEPPEADDASDLPVQYLGVRLEHHADGDAVTEMVALLNAERAYEMNASAFDAGKRLAERTIDVGRL